jgi:3-oxoacyl-[acyl-carrier-protein] synthase-1
MRAALDAARASPGDVGYLNLHGTGTPNNDAAEDLAVCAVFGTSVPCSSTKGATGHALGAAGAIEAAVVLLALEHGFIPAGLHRSEPDPTLHCRYIDDGCDARLALAASNSFGFGGSNACLLFGHGAR